jgi:hypothetical protein
MPDAFCAASGGLLSLREGGYGGMTLPHGKAIKLGQQIRMKRSDSRCTSLNGLKELARVDCVTQSSGVLVG